jgi:Rrf2 family nitric oxide-sensitive transcriptional repressor
MRLTLHTDYALRVLLYAGARPERLCAIGEMARAYGISRNHLMKVVQRLAEGGFVATVRGRSGGIQLARAPAEIRIGAVVRCSEPDFELADCTHCGISPACALKATLRDALAAFLAVLDARTLADLLHEPQRLVQLLGKPRPRASRHLASKSAASV